MADSDFWHELAGKFRVLDPMQCLSLKWIAFPAEKEWKPEIVAIGDACQSVKAQFEALATRAGLGLTSASVTSSGILGWLEAVQYFADNERSSEGIHTDEAGITRHFIGGTILRLCEVSANLCNALEVRAIESAEDPYTAVLESVVAPFSDSRNHLSVEARNRIRRAHIESERFRWESESLIESQRLDGQAATLERNKGNLQAARSVLKALRAEYSIFPEDQYREYMKMEIEAATNSLELYSSQRRLLEIEYYYPEAKGEQLDVPEDSAIEKSMPPESSVRVPASLSITEERRALLAAYKREGKEHGIRITDEMVAKAASNTWNERTPVQRWKNNDPRCTPGDDRKIRAVLKAKPHLKR